MLHTLAAKVGNESLLLVRNMVPEYSTALGNCRYGLVVRGKGYHTYRLPEVLAAGAVPVILNDHHALPFEDTWDWSQFAVLLSEREFLADNGAMLLQTLMYIDKTRYEQLRSASVRMFEAYMQTKGLMLEHIMNITFSRIEARVRSSSICKL